MINFRDNIVFLIAKAHQQSQGFLKGQLKNCGLTPVQCLILESLWEEEGLSVGEIGRRLVLDTATLAGVLDRMAAGGWVQREVSAEDARVTKVYLAEKARSLTAELEKIIEYTNKELLSNFSQEEKILFKRFLRDLNSKG
jgi:MarR family transcriptional regulator, organic hydroperoxide resistance regulator